MGSSLLSIFPIFHWVKGNFDTEIVITKIEKDHMHYVVNFQDIKSSYFIQKKLWLKVWREVSCDWSFLYTTVLMSSNNWNISKNHTLNRDFRLLLWIKLLFVFFVNINAFLVRKCFDILLTRPTQWGRAETYQGLQHDRAVIGACYLPQTRLCFMSHSSARRWRGSPLLSSSDVILWKFTLKVFSN